MPAMFWLEWPDRQLLNAASSRRISPRDRIQTREMGRRQIHVARRLNRHRINPNQYKTGTPIYTSTNPVNNPSPSNLVKKHPTNNHERQRELIVNQGKPMKRIQILILMASLSMAVSARAAEPGAGQNAPETTSADQAEPAKNQNADTKLLRMNFRDASLEQVLNYLSEAAGFIINVKPGASIRG